MFTPLRILILEDSVTDTVLMLYELSQAGIEPEWQRVETEAEYLEQLNTGWDLILADYTLPQFNAIRALRLLQERGLDIPLIVVTGSVSEEVAVECMKQGADDYLLKDRLVRLGQAVKRVVEEKKIRDQKRQAEAALQASEERFRRLAENAPDIIYRYRFTYPRGFEYISPAVTAISGNTPDKYYADPDLVLKIVHKDERRVLQQWAIGKELNQPMTLRWRKDSEIIWAEHRNVAIFDEVGNLVAIEGIARNISKRKQFEIQLQQQAEHDRVLGAIASRIRQSLNLEEIICTTVAEVRQLLKADRVYIRRFDANQDAVVVAESVVPNSTLNQTQTKIESTWLQELRAGCQQGNVQVINDINQPGLPPNLVKLLTKFQIKSMLVVPIFQDGYLWGLLAAHQCFQVRQWQQTEIDLLEQLATQVVIAIQQAQLFNQVQQQAQREQLLNQISQTINSSLDPNHILQEIVNLTGAVFEVDRVVIFSVDAEEMRVLNEWRKNEQVVSVLKWQAPTSEHYELLDPNYKFSFYRTLHAPKYAEIPIMPNRLTRIQQAQILSMLRVPILFRDQLFGGLSLHTTTSYRTFTEEEIKLLERIAQQAAIALYNAQSYENLEQLVKERTQELEQEKLISQAADRAKTEFLANMSHELRTPLTSILGFSNLLLEQIFGSLNAKQLQYVERISSSGEHLLALINDLLDLSKIEAGKEDLTLEVIDVEEICQACLTQIQERANKQGLELIMAIDSGVTTCVADQRRLKQILFNLLSNAVKFTDTGTVTLKVNKNECKINFSVIDTGIGITEADQATLFEPFRQLDSSFKRKYEGTGLGLALSRKLAQLHGGDIAVMSQVGHGSCFTVYLPKNPPGWD